MKDRDKFDELDAERRYQERLGAELLGFVDHKREPYEYVLEDDEEDVLDLQSMGIVPFLTKGDEDDV